MWHSAGCETFKELSGAEGKQYCVQNCHQESIKPEALMAGAMVLCPKGDVFMHWRKVTPDSLLRQHVKLDIQKEKFVALTAVGSV